MYQILKVEQWMRQKSWFHGDSTLGGISWYPGSNICLGIIFTYIIGNISQTIHVCHNFASSSNILNWFLKITIEPGQCGSVVEVTVQFPVGAYAWVSGSILSVGVQEVADWWFSLYIDISLSLPFSLNQFKKY